MKRFFGEPERDPQLSEALRRLEAPLASEDAEVLHRRIMAAARTRSAELRTSAPRWWEGIDRWIPVAVPLGFALSLAAGLLLPGTGDLVPSSSYAAEAAADSTLATAAFSDEVGAEQVAARLIAPQGGEWLFEQAVIQ